MPLTINADEYKSVIGLDDLYVAEVTQDDADGYVADTPEPLAPAMNASQTPAVNSVTQYADDAPYDTMSSEGETEITLDVTNIPVEMLAKLTGNTFDSASGRMFDHGATPPYHALMFRSMKSNGSYRYYSYLKGKFRNPAEEAASKSDTPDPKPRKLIYTAVKTVYEFDVDGAGDMQKVKRVIGDEDSTNFDGSTWFSQVQTPEAASYSALALSTSVPADDATGIVVTANVVLTFNNALVAAAINNVTLLDDALAPVAGATTLDATRKIMTINPTASLDASTEYTVVISGVTDIYGQTLTSVVTFTTAA